MNTNRFIRTAGGGLAAAAIALLASATVSAQVKTQETVAPGASAQNVTVERGEVVWVSGNNLMVKQEDGALRYFPDIPDSREGDGGGQRTLRPRSQTGYEAGTDHHRHDYPENDQDGENGHWHCLAGLAAEQRDSDIGG